MVAGKYVAEGEIMGSEMESEIEYIVDGSTLTGSMVVLGSKIDVVDGVVDGDHFKHICHVDTPMGKMKVKIDGNVNGDDITFTLKAPLGKSAFTGHRV